MDLLTFDNESELHKIKEFYPLARYTDHPYNGPQVNVLSNEHSGVLQTCSADCF